ncbi:hypothetical protein BB559_001958 [Furculomyces boomerangus]|uniref:Copper transport protein n=1 Tax=Furculomyces boomerangus TaxID=61424 RepID=A0A2T9YZ09_9FUNG|nr:hypothetical protein BB559_001958 [Furculomyces boomerangus]
MVALSGHEGHEGHDAVCAMHMSLNWETENVCVLLSSLRINSYFSLVAACFFVFLMGLGFERLRNVVSNWEQGLSSKPRLSIDNPTRSSDSTEQLESFIAVHQNTNIQDIKLAKSVVYGIMMFYSYCLMLIFMTYNGFLMISITLGAIVGNYYFGSQDASANRAISCH